MEARKNHARDAPADIRPAPGPARTADDILKAARDMVPLLRERAVAADRDRRIELDTYRRLQDAGLFHILKPRKYGGLELSEHEHAKVTMTLARGCASTAWVFSILDSDNMAVLAFPAQVQEEIWGTNTYATLAGNTNLNPKARAEKVPGGYRLTGQWGFCSGSDFSEWLIFNAPAGDDGEGHMFLVPREDTTTIDDWFPTGMRGTGSRTMAVEEVFVPGHRVQATRDTVQKLQERRALHPTFNTMYAQWPSNGRFSFASVAVGAAWGAVEYFAATAASSTRVANALGGTVRLADQDYVATEFAEAAGEIQMATELIERRSFEGLRAGAAAAHPRRLPTWRSSSVTTPWSPVSRSGPCSGSTRWSDRRRATRSTRSRSPSGTSRWCRTMSPSTGVSPPSGTWPPSPGPSRHPEHQAEGRRRRGRCRPLAGWPRPQSRPSVRVECPVGLLDVLPTKYGR